MSRNVDNWLRSYLEMAEDQESPEDFHLWCGISLIAATLERQVWIDRGLYTLYPNMYIIIVAGSAISRKSTAIDSTALSLLKDCPRLADEVNFISQKITAQAFISELHKQYKRTGVSACYIVADELAMFLGTSVQDATLVHILTKSYTCGKVCDYHTIVRGREQCNNLCINFLGGTTPEWIKSSLPDYAIAGGFAGRFVFVFQPRDWRKRAFPSINWALRKQLIEDLGGMRDIKGDVVLSKEAREWFENWYVDVFDPDQYDDLLKGYYARKHDTLLKVGMILNFSKRDKRVIEVEDLEHSLRLLNRTETYLPEIMRSIQTSAVGEGQRKVLSVIQRLSKDGKGELEYARLLRAVSYFAGAKELREILESLTQSGLVEEVVRGKKMFLKMSKTKL